MMIEEVNGHYTLWRNGDEYIVKQHNRIITKGTRKECLDYMVRHPYGTPRGKENVQ